ncbi:MAG: undecaprenyl-diphosphate phosphatase [Candidatus Aenigmatarchaeota archaeon]|nr:MAG: undecaprenyl-diphosphate phosphatase [Candidatus Aenigmarchaeota archaeon]
MDFLEAVVLAVVQGLTEWLPISSEGVASLLMLNFFGKSLTEAIYISAWLHTGTLLAAIVYFWGDIKAILKNLPNYVRNPNETEGYSGLTRFLLVSTITTVIIAAPIVFFMLESFNFSGGAAMGLIGLLLIITGLLQKFVKRSAVISERPGFLDALIAGGVQAFAVFPGLSRSGLTTSALLLRKHDPEFALKLSFLMSIPAVLIAEIGLILTHRIAFDVFSLTAIGVSFLLGLLTLSSLLRIAERVNFGYFCIFLGMLSLSAFFI